MTHTGEDLNMVVLDALTLSATKTELPPSQIGVDVRRSHFQARGTAIDDGRELATM
jgi:hypothetical protein